MKQAKKSLHAVIIYIFITLFGSFTFAEKNVVSLYDLKTKWRDIHDQEVSVDIAKGSYVIIGMVYTACPHACPMTISKIKDLTKAMNEAGIKDIKVVLASFDVKNDRPKSLKRYQEGQKLDPKIWSFLAANSDSDARQLAVTLGITYKDIGKGDFSHSNVITLLDKNGVILEKIDNLNAGPTAFIEAIQKLKN